MERLLSVPTKEASEAAGDSEQSKKFNYLKAKEDESSREVTLTSSRRWFHRFQLHYHYHLIKVSGEAAAADEVAA